MISGELKAMHHLPDGTEVVMMRAGPGELFAESALAAEHYGCDTVCVNPERVALLPVTAVTRAMANPDFARTLVVAMVDWQAPLSELALELSLEPETLYRVLGELERAEHIRREKRRLKIVS